MNTCHGTCIWYTVVREEREANKQNEYPWDSSCDCECNLARQIAHKKDMFTCNDLMDSCVTHAELARGVLKRLRFSWTLVSQVYDTPFRLETMAVRKLGRHLFPRLLGTAQPLSHPPTSVGRKKKNTKSKNAESSSARLFFLFSSQLSCFWDNTFAILVLYPSSPIFFLPRCLQFRIRGKFGKKRSRSIDHTSSLHHALISWPSALRIVLFRMRLCFCFSLPNRPLAIDEEFDLNACNSLSKPWGGIPLISMTVGSRSVTRKNRACDMLMACLWFASASLSLQSYNVQVQDELSELEKKTSRDRCSNVFSVVSQTIADWLTEVLLKEPYG